MRKLAVLLLVLGFVSGCASMKVNYDYAREADFSSYKTFQFKETDVTIQDTQPLAHQRLVEGIERELQGKGLQESDSPDVYVTYHGEDSENVSLDTTHFGYGYGPGWYWGGGMGSMGTSTTQVRTYTVGTLIVDIWDAKAKQLVWRGIASDTLSQDPQKNQKIAAKALAKMFKKFPPAGS